MNTPREKEFHELPIGQLFMSGDRTYRKRSDDRAVLLRGSDDNQQQTESVYRFYPETMVVLIDTPLPGSKEL